MQNFRQGQNLFSFPEDISTDLDALYNKLLSYVQAQNQQPLLQQQIDNLRGQLASYMLLVPASQTALNSNYTLKVGQITDLLTLLANYETTSDFSSSIKNYLPIVPQQAMQLNSNYTITTAQIPDLQNKLDYYATISYAQNNFLPSIVLFKKPLHSNYTITAAQIIDLDLSIYLLKQPSSPTAIDANYTLTSAQVSDLAAFIQAQTNLQNYTKLTDFNTFQTQVNTKFSSYLPIAPSLTTSLDQKYQITLAQISDLNTLKIVSAQVSDLAAFIQAQTNLSIYTKLADFNTFQTQVSTKFNNYLLITPPQTTSLNTNYQITLAQISDLNTLKIASAQVSDLATYVQNLTNLQNYTKIADFANYQTQVSTKFNNYMLNTPAPSTPIDPNYQITLAQISNLNTLKIVSAQVSDLAAFIQAQTNLSNYTKLTDFNTFQTQVNTNFNNYLLITPSQTTSFDIKYRIVLAQISDLNTLKITSAQVTDLSTYVQQLTNLQNYLAISNYNNDKATFALKTDLQNYLLTSPPSTTPLNSKYQIVMSQISDLGSLKISSTQVTDLSSILSSYAKKNDLQQYMLQDPPDSATLISQKYKIVLGHILDLMSLTIQSTQITDLSTVLSKYLLASLTQKTALDPNYTVTSAQITDLAATLSPYLPISTYNTDKATFALKSDISNISNFLLINPSAATQLNSNYRINLSQVVDDQISNAQTKIPGAVYLQYSTFKQNGQFTSTQIQYAPLSISNLLQTFQTDYNNKQVTNSNLKYYVCFNPYQSPFMKCILESDITITKAQITDLGNIDTSKLLPLNPTQPIVLDPNYRISDTQINFNQILQIVNNKVAGGLYLQYGTFDTIVPGDTTTIFPNTMYAIFPLNKVQSNFTQDISGNSLNQNQLYYLCFSMGNNNNFLQCQSPSQISIMSTQVADFTTAVRQLINTSGYLPSLPTGMTTFNANYRIQLSNIPDALIQGSKLAINSITNTQLTNGCVNISNLNSSMAPIFYSLYSMSQQDNNPSITNYGRTTPYQAGTPMGFYHYYKQYNNSTLTCNSQIYIGGSAYQFNATGSSVLTGATPYIQFDVTKSIYGASAGNCGAIGMFNCVGAYSTFIGSTLYGVNLTGNSTYSWPISFSLNNANNSMISYISTAGAYTINSDEALKHNVTEKSNHQQQLEKLLNLKIVTYSYGQKYQQDIDEYKKQLLDPNISEEDKKLTQQKIEDFQAIQAKCVLGFTYQDLDKNGFKYVLSDQQIMDDDYLDKQGIDKEKIKERIKSQQLKTISESAMIPYVIMGIKALNEKIENQTRRIDIIDQAMMKTHEIINEVSSQADQKIEEVKQNSLIHSINSDSVDDIKNTLNSLIYKFEQQQNMIKKLQNTNVYLNSQIEQMQTTIEKQNQDIVNLKLKNKIV